MRKSISIVVYAGLCNRLRAMASGVEVAKRLGYPITVYWNNTEDCRCDFKDLFKVQSPPVDGFSVVENHSFLHYVAEKRNLFFPKFLQSIVYDQRFYEFCWWPNKDIFPLINFKHKLFFQNCQSICPYSGLNKWLMPIDEIQNIIDNVVKEFSVHTIGLHIRGTDHEAAKSNSTLDKFMLLMDQEISKDRDVKFFLATDESIVKRKLFASYGNHIITNNVKLTRSSLDGMKGAVIDLFCLSKTAKILGSMNSTYSMTAAELGDIELIVVK